MKIIYICNVFLHNLKKFYCRKKLIYIGNIFFLFLSFLEEKIDHLDEKEIKTNVIKTKIIQPETLEVSSSSEEELEEEVVEDNEEEVSDKEDGQEFSDSVEEYIEEEEDEEEEEDSQGMQEVIDDDNKESIKHNDNVDLRTELKRRRALRLNMV